MSAPTPCLLFVRRVARAFQSAGGHDSVCLPTLQILSAKPGLVRAELTIGKTNLNRLGSLHGGLICTLTDTMGSLALASRGMYSTGVSTDISTTFVKAAGTAGDKIHVVGRVVSLGKTLATTRVELVHPERGDVLSFGSHTKFMARAHGHVENVEFDEEGQKVVKGKAVEEWTEEEGRGL